MLTSLILSASLALTPTAQANLTSYFKLQIMVGACSAYISDSDRAALLAEARAMPEPVATDASDLLWRGMSEPLSFELCVKHMPDVLLKAKAVLRYPLLDKPSEDDKMAALINERFGR